MKNKNLTLKEILINEGHIITILFIIKLIFFYYMVRLPNVITICTSVFIYFCAFILLKANNIKRNRGFFIFAYIFTTFAMYVDIDYYNYYNEYISINQLGQVGNLLDMGETLVMSIFTNAVLVYLDIPIVIYMITKKLKKSPSNYWFRQKKIHARFLLFFYTLLFLIVINPLRLEAFNAVSNTELITYHLQDFSKNTIQKLFYKSNDLQALLEKQNTSQDVVETLSDTILVTPETTSTLQKGKYEGIGEGKNIVLIQMESMQNFVINKFYNNQELTPNLNSLIKDNSIYFDNYYQNIGKGNTSDAEFSSLNGIYPVDENSCYLLYPDNNYKGLPFLLKDKGYNVNSFHGYNGAFWNRIVAHEYQGFDRFYSLEDFDFTENLNIGLSDKEMFKQSIEIMKTIEKPYFNFVITLTNHFPFEMSDHAANLELLDIDQNTMFGNYLRTVHYADEALGLFFDLLKENGLYEDTIFILYGDHHGLNCATEENYLSMTDFLGYEYDFEEMMNIPLIMHIPGSEFSDTISTVGAQVDLLPTIAYLMNLELEDNVLLGQNIFLAEKGFVALSSYVPAGSFISGDIFYCMGREGIFKSGRAKNIITHEEVPLDGLEMDYEKAIGLLTISKYMLEHNLLLNNSGLYSSINREFTNQ